MTARNRSRRRSRPRGKPSLARLRQELNASEKELAQWRERLSKVYQDEVMNRVRATQNAPIEREIRHIYDRAKERVGTLGRLFGSDGLTSDERRGINALRREFQLPVQTGMSSEAIMPTVARIEAKVRSLREGIANTEARMQTELEAAERKKGRLAELKAAAAAHHGKTRALGSSVRRRLAAQETLSRECPYCGNDLGNEPHADHIHPVVLGGQSREDNMVFVCKACNTAKGSLTLREFISRSGKNRAVVESRLERLKKRF